MTDRIKGLTVTLDPNIREDDAQAIIDAVSMIKGVANVETHVTDIDHYMAVASARITMEKDIFELIKKWRETK